MKKHDNDLFRFYKDELFALRHSAGNFSKQHPEIASKLDFKANESLDPHTERIVESAAFLSAMLQKSISDKEKSIAFHIISALYPNLINTFPPCSVVRFENDINISTSEPIKIKRGTILFAKNTNDVDCKCRTLYPLNIYPISIHSVNLQKVQRRIGGIDSWALQIEIKTDSVPLEQMQLNDILFYINCDTVEDSLLLYHSIFFDCDRPIHILINNKYVKINSSQIIPCGLNDEDSVCPVAKYTSNTIQLFQEMVNFKRKFMFFKIVGIDETLNKSNEYNIDKMSILIDINFVDEKLTQIVTKDCIQLNCTPIVNLFPVTSDPIRIDGTKHKYLLLPDQANDQTMEIHSVLSLYKVDQDSENDEIINPYFSLETDANSNISYKKFWVRSIVSAEERGMLGLDTFISIIDTELNPNTIYDDIIYAKTLCTNRFETLSIPTESKFIVDSKESSGYRAKLLHKFTPPISILNSDKNLWLLVSQLSSNHISITKSEHLWNFIRKLLSLFDDESKLKISEFIDTIKDIKTKEIVRRFGKDAWRGFVSGVEVSIYTDSESSIPFCHLLGTILNQYMSSSVSINSFIELKILSLQNNKIISKWAPTSGRKNLV